MKKVDDEINKKIIDMYKNGKRYTEISKELKISNALISRVLRKNNIPIRSKGGIFKLPEDEIIRKYKDERISSTKLAKEYNVSWTTILSILKANNIERTNNKDTYKNITLDNNYFESINSIDKAYFLGFMITDGCVLSERNQIQLDLSSKDREILEIFSLVLNNKIKIQHRKDKSTDKLIITSRKIKKDLSKYGVVPLKTGKEYLPNNIDKIYMSHLIRGLFDGDGWVTYSVDKNNRKHHQIGFCGNKEIVTQLRDYLVKELSIYNVKVIHTEEKLWQVTWSSIKDIDAICNYIYKDKDIYYLKRKYETFMGIPR